MFRLIYLTFFGKERMDAKTKSHLHESPKSMTVPLMVLGVLSLVGGFVGMPHIFGVTNYFEEWLAPVMHQGSGIISHAPASGPGDASMEWLLMGASVLLVAVSIFLAYYFYRKNTGAATKLRDKLSGVHHLLLNKYFVDEIYGALVIRPILYGSLFLWKFVDVVVIDGMINGMARLGGDLSDLLSYTQSGKVRTYATMFLAGVVILVAFFVLGD
jgi:NADH-quinone oxidoreductase subunit L